ncbi:MAG: GNAT family N-acetyltransferase [Acidobacteriota bacterium]
MSEITCTIETDPRPEDIDVIEQGLETYDREHAGPLSYDPLTLLARDSEGTVIGGLRGTVGGGWMYVLSLWVAPEHRGRGLGAQILREAEAEALRLDLPRVFLNTLSWQAPGFYEKQGYETFAVLEDAPPPHSRIFYRKNLA